MPRFGFADPAARDLTLTEVYMPAKDDSDDYIPQQHISAMLQFLLVIPFTETINDSHTSVRFSPCASLYFELYDTLALVRTPRRS